MKGEPMYMDWKISCFYNGNTPQSNLEVQKNLYQNPNGLFAENVNPKNHMKSQGTLNTQNMLKNNKV